MKSLPRLIWLSALALLLTLTVLLAGRFSLSRAQSIPLGLQWSQPQRIPGYDDQANAPLLIADQNRTVHAFNSLPMDDQVVVTYSRWSLRSGWTLPVDILLSPYKSQARLMDVFLDEAGIVHLIFFGGDDLNANIYYTSAPLRDAGRAPAWSTLSAIGPNAITPNNAALTGDDQGNLYMLYYGDNEGAGLYATYSEDGGLSWTEPLSVAALSNPTNAFNALGLYLDADGRLHAFWTEVNQSGNGEGVWYMHMDTQTMQWSEPIVLARRDPGDYEADWPSLIEYRGELFLIYQDSNPATRWMRRSADGGQTWSEPEHPFDYEGEYRQARMLVDEDGFLHLFLGNRTPGATHGMWHSVWLGDRWSDLEAIVAGPRVTSGPLIQRFDPSGPEVVLSQGNVMLIAWSTDPGAGRNGVWYSYAQLARPELPVMPLPTQAAAPTLTPTAAIVQASVADRLPTAPALPDELRQSEEHVSSPALGLTIAVLPVILLLTGIILIARQRLKS